MAGSWGNGGRQEEDALGYYITIVNIFFINCLVSFYN